MTLDTDRYYDRACHEKDLSDRERQIAAAEAAFDAAAAELDDAKQCLRQAAEGLASAVRHERDGLLASCLVEARDHLVVADRQSLPSDDQIIMGHIRAAAALLGFTLSVIEAHQ